MVSLFTKRFELGDRFEILDATSRVFQADQAVERDAATLDSECRDDERVGQQLLVLAGAGDFAKEIDWTQRGDEREVEPR
jgi:hypothetical protein